MENLGREGWATRNGRGPAMGQPTAVELGPFMAGISAELERERSGASAGRWNGDGLISECQDARI